MTAQVIQLKTRTTTRRKVKLKFTGKVLDAIGRPKRSKNAEVRAREHLTEVEVEALLKAATARGRYGQRDHMLILLAYRHGLRVSELVELEWSDVNLTTGQLLVRRKKRGIDSSHPIDGLESRGLRKLKKDWPDSQYLFVSERGGPMTDSNARKLIAAIGIEAGLPFPIHPHMLRHACGYKLANDGKDTRSLQHYLGHANIQHTVRYTNLAPGRFKGWWKN
jgi:type 1 fimbriae regulatory protein FimE